MKARALPFGWEVQNGGARSYLVGTCHNPDLLPVAEKVVPFIRDSDAVFTEGPGEEKLEDRHIFFPEATTINDVLTADQLGQVRWCVQNWLASCDLDDKVRETLERIERKKVWAVTFEIESMTRARANAGYNKDATRYQELLALTDAQFGETDGMETVNLSLSYTLSVDKDTAVRVGLELLSLRRRVRNYQWDGRNGAYVAMDSQIRTTGIHFGKKVKGLDDPDHLVGVHDSLSPELQAGLLSDAIDTYKAGGEKPNSELARAYLSGRIARLRERLAKCTPLELEYHRKMGEQRTRNWYQRTREALHTGGILIAAGTSHFIYGQNFLEFLREDGFSIRRL